LKGKIQEQVAIILLDSEKASKNVSFLEAVKKKKIVQATWRKKCKGKRKNNVMVRGGGIPKKETGFP